jgi:hypothetical protein
VEGVATVDDRRVVVERSVRGPEDRLAADRAERLAQEGDGLAASEGAAAWVAHGVLSP